MHACIDTCVRTFIHTYMVSITTYLCRVLQAQHLVDHRLHELAPLFQACSTPRSHQPAPTSRRSRPQTHRRFPIVAALHDSARGPPAAHASPVAPAADPQASQVLVRVHGPGPQGPAMKDHRCQPARAQRAVRIGRDCASTAAWLELPLLQLPLVFNKGPDQVHVKGTCAVTRHRCRQRAGEHPEQRVKARFLPVLHLSLPLPAVAPLFPA